ncbi:hypothetical protein, partial [Klebsiella pneumoniae]|uniref:hypothetical protein n=1 Tax=Klebsiella pneumoniae TaxID=573 RepID=UPI00133112A9
MTSDAEWQTDALNSAIATAQHRQQQEQEQRRLSSPAGRYEEMLAKGGRLLDRLVDSELMTPADAALTDARRDLLSMSVSPEADREVFK